MSTLTRGERFKDARLEHNRNGKQTMDEVYTATGVSASMIKDLEDDGKERSVGYDKIAILAEHYGVSADYLLSLTNDPKPKPCATDELGLSVKSVDWLLLLAKSSDETRYTEYLNKLFEMEVFQGLVYQLMDYFSALKAQSIAGGILHDAPPDKYFELLEEAAKDSKYDGMTQLYLGAFVAFENAFFNPGAAMLLDDDNGDDVIHVLDILELKIKRNLDSLLHTMEDCYE